MTYCNGGTITYNGTKRVHTFTWADLTTIRTNYIKCPGFENAVVTDDWTFSGTGSVTYSNATKYAGNYSAAITSGATSGELTCNTGVSVPNGTTVYASAYMYTAGLPDYREQCALDLYDATNGVVRVNDYITVQATWTNKSVFWTNNTGSTVTVKVKLRNSWQDSATINYYDNVFLDLDTSYRGYFDGDNGGCKWTGAYHNSTSIMAYAPLQCIHAGSVEYLVIGGGAGGAGSQSTTGDAGGGGGAGGLLTGNTTLSVVTYSIYIGGGGPGRKYIGVGLSKGANGTPSQLHDLVYGYGGGGGGQKSDGTSANGCGGGAGNHNTAIRYGGTGSQGYAGGNCSGTYATYRGGAGGGGMGGAGGNRPETSAGGIGGIGVSNSISGSSVQYCGGGGGGGTNGAAGGTASYGGGAGGPSTGGNGYDATTNSGGGGGGATYGATYYGGRGGDGLVIVSYEPTFGPGRTFWMY